MNSRTSSRRWWDFIDARYTSTAAYGDRTITLHYTNGRVEVSHEGLDADSWHDACWIARDAWRGSEFENRVYGFCCYVRTATEAWRAAQIAARAMREATR